MTLVELNVNQDATISGFLNLEDKIATRLRELGLSQGRTVTCLKQTPFGGPCIYQTGDSIFSLESSLAKVIEVNIN